MLDTPDPIRVALLGRSAFRLTVADSDGSVFYVNVEHEVSVTVHKWPGSAALFTLSLSAGSVLVEDDGRIYCEMSPANAALLSTMRSFTVVAKVTDVDDLLVFVTSRTLLPTEQYIEETYPTSMNLSTRFKNTVQLAGVSGGAGFLDGIATLTRTLGCVVEFSPAGAQPQSWILETWASAAQNTAPDAYQLPADFNAATNPKVWRRTS